MSDRIVGRVHKIDVRENAKMKVYYESRRDLHTGLFNKSYSHLYISSYIHDNPDKKAAIIIIDIDNFKLVNDQLGHLFGDEVLRNVAKELKTCCYAGDIVGRIGGDEFIICIKDYKRIEQVTECVSRVCSAISSIYVGEQNNFTLSASCGIALFPDHGNDIDTLFSNADKALFYVKNSSKNGYAFFDFENEAITNSLNEQKNASDYTTFNKANVKDHDIFSYELTELAFNLMEDSKDVDSTINLLLRTLAEHYNLSIIAIREITENSHELEYIYEYMNDNYEKRLGTRWNYSDDGWTRLLTHYTNGYYIYHSTEDTISSDTVDTEHIYNVKTVLEIPVYTNNSFLGCVDFLSVDDYIEWKPEDIATLKMFCRILSSYLLNMRAFKKTTNLLEQINAIDSLTGFMKYDNFIKTIKNYIDHNDDPNKGLAIIYSDIRHFEAINDKYGFDMGNSLIEYFSGTIKDAGDVIFAACRVYSDNIVTATAYDNKYDHNAFIKHVSDHNHMVEEELQRRFLDQHIVINTGIFITHDTKDIDIEIAISNANMARKRAKTLESEDAILFTPDIIDSVVTQMELSSSLPHAIDNGELQVYYQPKIECGSEKVIGAEALIRWIKPDGTFIYPDQFIPLFETNGLIVEVDYFVYKNVFEHIRQRLDNNLPVVPISMNVSRIHLISDGIVDYIKTLFDEYKIPPELIEFELTENIYIKNMHAVLPLIEQLRSMGIKISMDDFGSGHSSLNELNSLPIDILKLDKVFMKDTLNEKQQIILSSIVEMAKKLNIAVLCEGVETPNQNEFLRKIGCDMVQGYYYSKPLCEEDFVEYIKNHLNEAIQYIHFSFDNTLLDDSNKYEGKFIGDGVTFSDGPANTTALHFAGGEHGHNIVELPPEIYPLSNYTITMWFKEDEEQLCSALMYTSFYRGYSSIVPRSSDLKSMFRLKDMSIDSSLRTDAAGILSPRRDIWNFIAVSYNYRTKTSSLFLNGIPAGKYVNAPMLKEPMRILLGGDVYRDSFKGSIADLRIYNQELSPIEILYSFNQLNR